MLHLADIQSYEFFRPLVTGWLSKIEAALSSEARRKWQELADECLMFYSKSAAAMWDPVYSRKFWRGMKAPIFRVTINKAFELVAVFGPNLLWDTPHRTVNPKRMLEIPPELFEGDEQTAELYQALQQMAVQQSAADKLIAHLMQAWLNYSPTEIPGGGLEVQNELAVTDALIKGRGCLWPMRYSFPGSERNLTGALRDRPENLIIDPDFKTIGEAKWIARRRTTPHWELERMFELPPGTLKNKATLESTWHYAELKGSEDRGGSERDAGKTNDLVVWYEIFSKLGAGARMTGMPDFLKDHLERTVGDYAYLAITPDSPFPLNCSSDKIRRGATDDEVRAAFSWPVPLWRDNRWPVDELDFYPDPEGPYPIPPLAPAMGEIKALNVIVPMLVERTWRNSRDLWAVLGAYYDELKKQLDDGDVHSVFAIPPGAQNDIRKIVQLVEQKPANVDNWRIVELLSNLIDKRTGLTEFAYGRNEDGTQNRTAEETMAKARAVGVRPEYMQKKVKGWQSRLGSIEALYAWLFVEAADVEPLMGQAGAMLWQQFVKSQDFERIVRGMAFDVSASSIRRPDRDRDVANFQQVTQQFLPLMQAHGQLTGDFTAANGLMKKWGDYHDADMSECFLPPPQRDEEMEQLQKAQAMAELEKTQADVENRRAQAAAKLSQAEQAGQGQAAEQAAQMFELELDADRHDQELLQDAQRHTQDLQQDREKFRFQMAAEQAKTRAKIQTTLAQGQAQVAVARQKAKLAPKAKTNGKPKAGSMR